MGTMTKIRDNTGIILWILVFAFGVIWVLQDSGGLDVVGNVRADMIASVDGESISVEQYTQVLDRQLQQYQAQTGEPMPPQMVDMTREQVFNALVEDRLRQREIERLGIAVTDEEVYNLVLGDTPHPLIQSYFGDGQGGVNRELLRNFIANPEVQQDWIQIEEIIRADRRSQKLDNLIASTVRVSDADVEDEYRRRNLRADAEYVALRYAAVSDDSVEVTDRDLRNFYQENREDYRRERTYTVNYVGLSKDATPEDSALVVRELERVRDRFASTDDDSLFLAQNASERPYSDAYFRPDELDPQVAEAVFENPEPGQIVGPILAGTEAHLIKILEVQPSDEPAVRAQHILIRAQEGDEEARAAAREELNQIRQRVQGGEDFGAVARETSDDPGSAVRGGDLGYFGRGAMVAPFEEAAFGARVGALVGPVETQYGYHLIRVTDREEREVRIADLAHRIRADIATLNRIQERLDDLQYYASEGGDFGAEAERLNLTPQQVLVQEEQDFIPGLGNAVTILNFLEDADEGDVSSVLELNDQFVVLHVQDIQPEGYRSLDEVRAELEPRARLAKKADVQVARLENALSTGGFEQLAGTVGAQQQSATVSYSSPVVSGLGREPRFAGTVFGLEEGETSPVIEGESAAYVLRVTAIHEPAPISDAQREQLRNQLLQQRRTAVQNQWLASLREKAEITDNRSLFTQ